MIGQQFGTDDACVCASLPRGHTHGFDEGGWSGAPRSTRPAGGVGTVGVSPRWC